VSNPGTFIVRGQTGAEVEVFLPLVLR
jgi:hypothetical protein